MKIPKKWLITGGCGFIGTNFIKNLLSHEIQFIRIVDNLTVGTSEDLARVCKFMEVDPSNQDFSHFTPHSSLVQLVVSDILDADFAIKASQGMDVIVHLAANSGVGPSIKSPKKDMEVNVIGTLNYLEAARINNVGKFIFASSGATIGECEPPIYEEMVPHPVSPYGASKLAGEAYCSAYYHTFGLNTVALRFSNVYGPGSHHKNSVVAKFIRQAIEYEILEIYGDGKQTRDFIYIDDLSKAIYLSATRDGIGGEIFQIATNTETTVKKLTEKLLYILREVGLRDVKIDHTAPRLGDVQRNFSDTCKARETLDWRPEIGLSKGLRNTIEWFIRF